MPAERVERRLVAILVADVVGYSRLVGMDEEGTIARLKALREELIDPSIAGHNGRIVKTTGDGILVEFASVVDAVRSAVEVQRALAERETDVPEDRRIAFRVGVNLGDIVIDGDDILGDGVNVAARLEGLAEPGGICIPRKVFHEVRNKLDVGYEFIGEQTVKNIETPIPAYRVLLEPEAAGQIIGEGRPGRPRWQLGAVAAGAVAVIAVAVTGVWWQPWVERVEPASVERMAYPLPDKPSIAVLPFTNLSDDPEQEYFADGMTEDIITDLSKISGLFVIARNSTFTYKGKAVKVKRVAEELGVRYVLEGSVRRAGDRVRINAQLVDATTGGHLWAERYDGEFKDVFKLQDQVTRRVVAELAVTLKANEQERLFRRHTENLEAYDTFLRARRLLALTRDANVLATRKKLFERVIEIDPGFAGGYAGLSFHYSRRVRHGRSTSRKADIDRAFDLAQRAVAVDDTFGWSYVALGSAYLMKGEHDRAIAAMREAIRIQPSDADAQVFLGYYLHWAGRAKEAIDAVKRAARLNPKARRHIQFLGMAYVTAGQYADAIATFNQRYSFLARVGSNSLAFLAAAYAATGQDEKARAAMRVFLDKHPGFTLSNYLHPRLYKRPEDRDRYLNLLRKAGLPESPPLELPDKPSIAVLPFTNMSGDPGQDYLSDGITESLITGLAKQPDMFVIARNSSFTYKGKAVKAQRIGRDLGVRYLLEGSVQRAGERIRVTAQLIEAATGRHLWAESYDRDLRDLFAVQDDITRTVAVELAVKLILGESARSDMQASNNVEAYDRFLRGLAAYREVTKEANARAASLFDEAIALDPQYTRAIAVLGWVRLNEARFRWGANPGRSFKAAEELARRAIAINEESFVGHMLLGRVYTQKRRFEEAIAKGKLITAIEPSNAEGYASFAATMVYAGKPEEASALIKKALRLSPYPPIWFLIWEGQSNYFTGRHEAATASFRKILARTRRGPVARSAWSWLIAAYMEMGREADARAEAGKLLELHPKFSLKKTAGRLRKSHKDPAVLDRPFERMREAGLPE